MIPSAAAPAAKTAAKTAAAAAPAAAAPVAAAPGNLQDPLASNATAYTQGADIAFGPGSAAADSASGQLLGHELTHTAQQ